MPREGAFGLIIALASTINSAVSTRREREAAVSCWGGGGGGGGGGGDDTLLCVSAWVNNSKAQALSDHD